MSSLAWTAQPSMRVTRRTDKLLWAVGPGLVITLHLLGLIYLLLPSRQETSYQSPAAAPIVVTMAVMPSTSHPFSQDSVARQEKVTDEPPPLPVKLKVAEKEVKDAEVKAVVNNAPPKKVENKHPNKVSHQHPELKHPPKKVELKADDSVSSVASTRSNSSEQISHQNQAPMVGALSTQAAAMQQSWQSLILAQLQRDKRYPGYALHMKQEDTVIVRFTIDRSGNVLETAIVKSKGYAALDRESLQLLARSSPLPKPPASAFAGLDKIELMVPVSFYIRNS